MVEASFQVEEYSPAVQEVGVVPSLALVKVPQQLAVHRQTTDVVGLHVTMDSEKLADVLHHQHRQIHSIYTTCFSTRLCICLTLAVLPLHICLSA